MSNRLDRVRDWSALAEACAYQLKAMAREGRVSERTLRRYFQKKLGVSPKAWLDAERIKVAVELISRGDLVKTAAANLHFKQRSHLSKVFKKITGKAPTQYTENGLK